MCLCVCVCTCVCVCACLCYACVQSIACDDCYIPALTPFTHHFNPVFVLFLCVGFFLGVCSTGSEYIKSIVFGGLDGIITTFAIVAAVAGAGLSVEVIIMMVRLSRTDGG